MTSQSVAVPLMILIASLTISSICISFFTVAVLGYSIVPFGGVNLNLQTAGFSNSTDLSSSCSLSNYDLTGTWVCDGTGLTGSGEMQVPLNVKSQDGIYKNSYHISQHSGEYTIIVTDTNYGDYIHIKVKPDGLHIPSTLSAGWFGRLETGDAVVIPITGASDIQNVVIDTLYNINTNELTIGFNGQSYRVEPMKLPPNYLAPAEVICTSGVISDGQITIASISNNFVPTQTDTTKALDGLAFILAFFGNLLAIVIWNIDPAILPWELNIIGIKTQCIGIVICVLLGIRG